MRTIGISFGVAASLFLTVAWAADDDSNKAATPREDIVIADFEGSSYGRWVTTGVAFGPGPVRGDLPTQHVTGFKGRGLANSFHGGDRATGTLNSPEFKVERNYINFLIGGGSYRFGTCMNLLVDGKPQRTATGRRLDILYETTWDVSDLVGKTARIQVVDTIGGPWGHILVDDIVQSDSPASSLIISSAPLTPVEARAARRQRMEDIRAGRVNNSAGVADPGVEVAQPTQVAAASPINTIEQPVQPIQRRQRGLPTTTALAPGASANLRLDEFSHALDVQLSDNLGGSKLFSVLEDKDLKDALQGSPLAAESNSASRRKLAIAGVVAVPTLAERYGLKEQPTVYDLKNKDTLGQFGNAGINFLLITTVEDMDENHLDGATVTRDFEYVSGQRTGWWVEDLSGDGFHLSGQHGSTSSWKRETVRVSPMLQKEQSIRVTLRSRLFDSKTGEIIGSKNKTYARGRSYMASARGNNELSMGDLYQTAARDLADWERTIVEDFAFPIKVVKIDEDGVLINRGSETGIGRNTYYNVWVLGEELKDPDTGEVLGKEETRVGKVLIVELQSRFSKARIVEDKGIKPGAVLRWTRDY
jgi:hypothetical protein